MHKIVRLHSFGGSQEMRIEDVPPPPLAADEVRIAVKALGLNRAEIVFSEGKYLERAVQFPCRIGYEAAGVIEAVGTDVADIAIGDEVSVIPAFKMSQYGVYGEYAVVPSKAIVKHPDNFSMTEAAAAWMQYLTAYGALIEFGKISANTSVLVTAASSSVGLAAIQLCNMVGAKCIATTRSAQKKERLLAFGADHVIVTNEENIVKQAKSLTEGKGVDFVFDAVAGPVMKHLANLAAYQGSIYVYGALSLSETQYPLMISLGKGLTIRGYTMMEITSDAEKLNRAKTFLLDAFSSGALKPCIDREFALDQIIQAHEYMMTNQQFGKVVVTV